MYDDGVLIRIATQAGRVWGGVPDDRVLLIMGGC